MEKLTVVLTLFWLCVLRRESIRRLNFFCQMRNRTVVSTIFLPYIVSNLSIVSNLLSNEKSYRYFNNFLALHLRQSIHRFNSFVKWKIFPMFQQFFGL